MKYLVTIHCQNAPKAIKADGFFICEGWVHFYRNDASSTTPSNEIPCKDLIAAFHQGSVAQIDSEGSGE